MKLGAPLLSLASLEVCGQQLEERQVTLACRWAIGSNAPIEMSAVIDFHNKTFNGQPAQISDAEIRVTFSNPNRSEVELSVNR